VSMVEVFGVVDPPKAIADVVEFSSVPHVDRFSDGAGPKSSVANWDFSERLRTTALISTRCVAGIRR
jgi:hypothetical protein